MGGSLQSARARPVGAGLGRAGARLVMAVAAAVGVTASAGSAVAQLLKATPVATGLSNPLGLAQPPGDPSRLFVVEQRGKIKVVDVLPGGGYSVRTAPLVDVASKLGPAALEFGLLGAAFHPGFASNRYLFVTYTPPASGDGTTAGWGIARLRVSATDPNVADIGTFTPIITVTYTLANHRAGWLGFGPDGYLYATTGDGGEMDPLNAASNMALLRGKVLRIDVTGADGVPGTPDDDGFPGDAQANYAVPPTNPFVGVAGVRPEIWASGLRNPWRASFDRRTGDLWIGDVGQLLREEIDFQEAASAGGMSYGWRCMEGTQPTGYVGCAVPPPESVAPAYEYTRQANADGVSGGSVTGGYVYRGCAVPSLRGSYFFGDWLGRIWTGVRSGTRLTGIVTRTSELFPPGATSIGTMVSFGEDSKGELYYVVWHSTNGAVYKIEPRTPLPGGCPCVADFDSSAGVDLLDVFAFLNAWFAECAGPGPAPCTRSADVDGLNGVDLLDVFVFLARWFDGC